jgi:hypothetical protein
VAGFLRVALAANAAKKQYRAFTEPNVTPKMIAPEIQIYAAPQSLGGTAIANVQRIVVLPHNSKDSSRAIHPTRMNEASQEYKNLFGSSGERRGILAVFPLDVWTEDNAVHVGFDTGIPSSNGAGALEAVPIAKCGFTSKKFVDSTMEWDAKHRNLKGS